MRVAHVALLITGFVAAPAFGAEPPNVLIIMADDCTFSDLPIYGGQNAATPAIDQFAAEGMTFNRAYVSSAMCQPCRAELYTGLYPMSNGCAWNHSASRAGIRSMPDVLGAAGYRVGLAGKVHVLPEDEYPFESISGFDSNCVRNPTQQHQLAGIAEFMTRDEHSPFCLVVALVEPHVPWVMGDASAYPPAEIELPINIADTPRTRQDFSRYLAEVSYMDSQVGEILHLLTSLEVDEDTLVLFTSEQGAQFPGCKWTNWDTGLHTALIARWTGRIPAGVRTDALVQYADILPTLVECAALETTAEFDGTSFRSVLLGESNTHREYAFGMHNNLPEGPAYPIRSITDGEFHFIRNLVPEEVYIEKHLMGTQGDGALNNPYWSTWVWNASTDAHTYELVSRYLHRPGEELYRLTSDPFEMHNLAGDPEFTDIQRRLSNELDRWMAAEGDPGVLQDTPEALEAARRGRHLFPAD